MKTVIVAILLFICSLPAYADLTLQEIRTASDNILVAFFMSNEINVNEVNSNDISSWKINGQQPSAIHKFVTESNACEHHIYLEVPRLVNGTQYTLQTPHGDTTFVFDDHTVFCEAIKTNQNAYSTLSRARYANFAIWLGTGGSRQISGGLPEYEVFEATTGKVVSGGRLLEKGQDTSSGDFVYRIDLSAVPEGGPYKIAVNGYGCSYPFGVGSDFSRRLAHIAFRGLYYQRCGCPIIEPYGMDLRMTPCHSVIYEVNGPIGEANIDVTGTEPTFRCYGGYHDAGDADRRAYHMVVPVILLTAYEAFPGYFTDNQFNIPDIFDADFNITGKGNGIPDIIDEAEWGTFVWEYLQEPDGGVHWGTETRGYAEPFAAPMDQDIKKYGTVVVDNRATAMAAGLFMHLARILKPYKPERSEELRQRAEKAMEYVKDSAGEPHKLYFAVQKYLLTGDEAAHQQVKDLVNVADNYVNNTSSSPESFGRSDYVMAGYFHSYIIEQQRPTDAAVVQRFKTALKNAADRRIELLNTFVYPVGNSISNRWWGSNVAQGKYAYPCILQWGLTKEQKYIDAASQLMDYNQGLNPIGKCYLTGTGFDRVYHPHDRESAYTIRKGWGPKPGIHIYGPGLPSRYNVTVLPEVNTLPRERQWVDNRGAISLAEFTVHQTMAYPAAIYPILAQGGTWDEAQDPFARK